MEVEVTIKVDGRMVGTQVQQVDGTLDQMEETIHALGKKVAAQTLQASVEAVELPRPLFRKTAESCGTEATNRVR
jgi:hypothetical protein